MHLPFIVTWGLGAHLSVHWKDVRALHANIYYSQLCYFAYTVLWINTFQQLSRMWPQTSSNGRCSLLQVFKDLAS